MNKGLHAVRVKRFSALAPPPLGTALYYPGLPGFGSTIIDRSGYNNHGTITGATWTRLPSGLPVLSYDGTDDYVDCGSAASLVATTALSLEAWVKVDLAALRFVFDKHKNADSEPYYEYAMAVTTAGKVEFSLNVGGTRKSVTSTATFSANTWTHLCCTWDGSTMLMYINGVVDVTTFAASGTITSYGRSLLLGIRELGVGYPYKGLQALNRVYKSALSPLVINQHRDNERRLFGV